MDNKGTHDPVKEKQTQFLKELNELLNKFNYTTGVRLTFPDYNKYPSELDLAILIMNKHNPKYRIDFVERKETPNADQK